MKTPPKLTTHEMMARLRKFDMDAADKIGHMASLDLDVLVAAATGKLDLNQVAALLVADRGIGRSGEWVGHAEAASQMDSEIAKLAARRAPSRTREIASTSSRPRASRTYRADGRAVNVTIPED